MLNHDTNLGILCDHDDNVSCDFILYKSVYKYYCSSTLRKEIIVLAL